MASKKNNARKLSPTQRRDLDIEIGFLEGLVRRDGRCLEALQMLGDDYTRRGRFKDGLGIDRQLTSLRPDDPLVHYNLACSFSLTRQFAEAADALRRAIACGYRDFKWLRRDPDLASLRKHSLFQNLREEIPGLDSEPR